MDLVMIFFFLVIPVALIVSLVLLARTRRKLRETEQAVQSTYAQLLEAEHRVQDLLSRSGAKSGNLHNNKM
ncbi:MAG: hypothetical protein IJ751_09610 [Oscillospiraceae bacterium]|nr:hypothetical protein [Oscillospiraceae bacterium]